MQVEFNFDIDDQVATPFGDKGYITMCAFDENRAKTYYVKTSKQEGWYMENKICLFFNDKEEQQG